MPPALRNKSKRTLLNTATRSAAPPVVARDSQSTQEPLESQSSQSFETELRDINAASFDAESLPSINATPSGPSNASTPSRGLPETPTPRARAALTHAATAPSATSSPGSESPGLEFDARFVDNFDGIDWRRLPEYTKPLRTQKFKKSVLYAHGYRVALRSNMKRIFFVCRYCHIHRAQGNRGILETTSSTTSAWNHVEQRRQGHGHLRPGKQPAQLELGQRTLGSLMRSGVEISQEVSNALGNFNQQRFRLAVVGWLAENNHPLREVETPSFRSLLRAANPEAEMATFRSHTSVAAFLLRLYANLLPRVQSELSGALSKVHISFDGWSIKGGKSAFCGLVAHYVDSRGKLCDLPLALPQLSGAHTGERVAGVVIKTLEAFGINDSSIGYFTLDNATNNDTAVNALGNYYGFFPQERRLRCCPHSLNLVGQTVIFGADKDAFENDPSQHGVEKKYLREWREKGPIGVLVDVIHSISTPQQHELFYDFQRSTREVGEPARLLEPIKPVVTRWNSYLDFMERAVLLHRSIDALIDHRAEKALRDKSSARARGKAPIDAGAPTKGLSAADWATINQYIEVLQPLKEATKRLEGRGDSGRFGAIYEVYPTFEYLLSQFEQLAESFTSVDFNEPDAPEDHLKINVTAAHTKLSKYYTLLEDSPVYYASTVLHPYYKYYFVNSWTGEYKSWLDKANQQFQELWAKYKLEPARPVNSPPRKRLKRVNNIDDYAELHVKPLKAGTTAPLVDSTDEFERWWNNELSVPKDHTYRTDPIRYWLSLRDTYPRLSQLAVDLLSIPASSCYCERVFSEVGDMMEPKRRKMSPQLLSTITCVRSWLRAGYSPRQETPELSELEIQETYQVSQWDEPL